MELVSVIEQELKKTCQIKADLLNTRHELEGEPYVEDVNLVNFGNVREQLRKKPLTTARFAIEKFDTNLERFQSIVEELNNGRKHIVERMTNLNELSE
jgi:hypothetical protein